MSSQYKSCKECKTPLFEEWEEKNCQGYCWDHFCINIGYKMKCPTCGKQSVCYVGMIFSHCYSCIQEIDKKYENEMQEKDQLIKKLQETIVELKARPGGDDYLAAMEHFNSLNK